MNKKTDAVVFDMDGVIFDTERLYREAWILAAKEFKIENIEKIIPKIMGASSVKIKELFSETYGDKLNYDLYHDEVEAVIKQLLDKYGLIFKPGASELFEFLKDNKIPAAVATSTKRERVNEYFEKAGIHKYFDCIVTGSDVQNGKPHPEIYLKACEGLRVSPENTFGIEDSYNGIRAVYNAGMMPIMVPDLLEPDENIKKLLFKKCNSLFDVAELIKNR